MVALYNAEKQELIGVFSNIALASRYLFPFGIRSQRRGDNIHMALKKKCRITISDVANKIAVRKANEAQVELLGKNDYYINANYRGFIGKSAKSFDSTKESYKAEVNRKIAK